MLKTLISTITFLLISGLTAYSQSADIPNILSKLSSAKDDTAKVSLLIKLSYQYLYVNPDSTLILANQAMALSEKLKYQDGIATAYVHLGSGMHVKGDYETAVTYQLKADSIFSITGNKNGKANALSNIGNAYYYTGKYDLALKYLIEAQEIDEEIEFKPGLAKCYLNMGSVYLALTQYDKSVEYYNKARSVAKEIKNQTVEGQCLNNLGVVFRYTKKYDEAIKAYEEALVILKAQGNKEGIAENLLNLGDAWFYKGEFEKSRPFFNEAMSYYKELHHKKGLAIAAFNLASVDDTMGFPAKAIPAYEKALVIAEDAQTLDIISIIYKAISSAYARLGDYKNSLEYYKLHVQMKDSILNVENQKQINEMQTKYETEKVEKENKILGQEKELQNLQLAKQQEEIDKQRILVITFISGFLLILVFLLIVARLYRQKQKANVLLAEQNVEIRTQKEEIEAQRDEIEAQRDEITTQRDVATEQRDLIGHQKKEILDSIHYARRIQRAILPPEEWVSKYLPEHFILFRPRDIVSGDFYWVKLKGNKLVFAAADCTGHGVPGAFMSMMGVGMLNEIVNKPDLLNAGEMLDQLRDQIIRSLHQSEHALPGSPEQEAVRDGMDMALCILDLDTNELQFAGANNPCWIIPAAATTIEEIQDISGSKMPVGIHHGVTAMFQTHIFQLSPGDQVCIFSDGYADQFGGPQGRKYMYKRMKSYLLSLKPLPLTEQKARLTDEFDNWKGEQKQVDDVLVMGIRI